ncbi:MAG TPA: hypothetical protein VD993_11855 [Chitinophagaceae bacterium]|nr:hypothetical protein [Chitinophagaceae bacterium]
MRLLIIIGALISAINFSNCNSSDNGKASTKLRLDKDCVPIIERFFARIQSAKHKEAIDSLLLSNPYINFNDSLAVDLRQKFNDINEYSGKYWGYKLIKKREIEGDVAIYSYLVKYEKKFYRFIFIFYKASDVTRLYKFSYNDMIDLELEEALRLHINISS